MKNFKDILSRSTHTDVKNSIFHNFPLHFTSPYDFQSNVHSIKINKPLLSSILSRISYSNEMLLNYFHNEFKQFDFVVNIKIKNSLEFDWINEIKKNHFVSETFEDEANINQGINDKFFLYLCTSSMFTPEPILDLNIINNIYQSKEDIKEMNEPHEEEKNELIPITAVENIQSGFNYHEKSYDFEANGYPNNALNLYNIENEYFENLTKDLKKIALEKGKIDYLKKQEENLKLKIDPKLLIQTIRENNALSQIFNEKPINFKDSLSENDWQIFCDAINDLKEQNKIDLLKMLPDELINELPNHLKDIADKAKKNYIDLEKKESFFKINYTDFISFFNIDVEEKKNFESEIRKYKKFIYEESEEFDKIFNQLEFYDDLPKINDEIAMILLLELNSKYDKDNIFNEETNFYNYLTSLMLIPQNAYKFLDSLTFLISSFENLKICDPLLIKNSKYFDDLIKFYSLNHKQIMEISLNFFVYLFNELISISLLIQSKIIFGNPLIFENATFESLKIIDEMRRIMIKTKSEITEINYQIKDQNSILMIILKDILIFKEDIFENKTIQYPKMLTNITKSNFLKTYISMLKFSTLNNNFACVEQFLFPSVMEMIDIVFLLFCPEAAKYSEMFKNKKIEILAFAKTTHFNSNDLSLLQDRRKRLTFWIEIIQIFSNNLSEIKNLRHDFKIIINKLKTMIYKVANLECNKNQNLDYINFVSDYLQIITEKIHKNEIILNFFKDYFDLSSEIFNVLGTDFYQDESSFVDLYMLNRHIFKLFIDLYSFLNPLDNDGAQFSKESNELNNLNCLKLSKIKTRGSEQYDDIFKKEKIINDDFKQNPNFEISLNNLFSSSYGNYTFFVEKFMDYGFNSSKKLSKTYLYYIKKTIDQSFFSLEIKLLYIR